MAANKRRPALIDCPTSRRARMKVFANGSRRNPDGERHLPAQPFAGAHPVFGPGQNRLVFEASRIDYVEGDSQVGIRRPQPIDCVFVRDFGNGHRFDVLDVHRWLGQAVTPDCEQAVLSLTSQPFATAHAILYPGQQRFVFKAPGLDDAESGLNVGVGRPQP